MTPAAITLLLAQAQHPHRRQLLHLFLSMGMLGLFLLSAIDASFIPLLFPEPLIFCSCCSQRVAMRGSC